MKRLFTLLSTFALATLAASLSACGGTSGSSSANGPASAIGTASASNQPSVQVAQAWNAILNHQGNFDLMGTDEFGNSLVATVKQEQSTTTSNKLQVSISVFINGLQKLAHTDEFRLGGNPSKLEAVERDEPFASDTLFVSSLNPLPDEATWAKRV